MHFFADGQPHNERGETAGWRFTSPPTLAPRQSSHLKANRTLAPTNARSGHIANAARKLLRSNPGWRAVLADWVGTSGRAGELDCTNALICAKRGGAPSRRRSPSPPLSPSLAKQVCAACRRGLHCAAPLASTALTPPPIPPDTLIHQLGRSNLGDPPPNRNFNAQLETAPRPRQADVHPHAARSAPGRRRWWRR